MERLAGCALALSMIAGGATSALADGGALAPPAGARILLRTAADGVQVYTCQASGSGFGWVFKAPEAALFDEHGRQIGKHFAGPSWQSFDGSLVSGEVAAKADAPSADSIPWLLLRAKTREGTGQFGQVAFIQRIDTKGGVAPASGCDSAHAGAEAQIRYSAVYVFYAAP